MPTRGSSTDAVRRPTPDWADLQYFLAVAEAGAIGVAARRLRVNHSTVLRRIARLERTLACRLFDRLPGGYALTASGNSLAEHLAGLNEQVGASQRQLAGLDPAIEGPVRVTSGDLVVEGLLMSLLARFRQRHPGLRIHLTMSDAAETLSQRAADIAVRVADQAPPGLVARRVGGVEVQPCASRRYLATVPAASDWAAHRWVAFDESSTLGPFESWFRRHVPPGRVVARIDSLVGVADAVAGGLGVGMLPRLLLQARPELVALASAEPSLGKPVWLLMHPDAQHSARVQALFTFLHDALLADPRLRPAHVAGA